MRWMLVPAVIAGALACGRSSPPAIEHVPLGTWGGDDAGLIVAEESAHAHVGCTLGDVAGPLTLDDKGRFDIDGTYNVDAFPIDLGIRHPARFSGETDGRRLTFSVRLTDTGQTFSSGTLVLGRAPQMRNCPICRR